jgi:queuosine biosynthesis protein QueC
MKMYDKKTIIESLVVGRGLTNNTFEQGKKHPYKMPQFTIKNDASTDTVINALHEVIEKETKHANKIGLLLSGGKDSRVLAGLAKNLGIEIECLTYRGNENEIKAAQNVAKALNYNCKIIDVPIEHFFNKSHIENALDLTQGNPHFFNFVYFFGFKDQLDYDIIFSGEVMTEFMDAGEYRWYEGKPKEGLLQKELYLPLVKEPYYSEAIDSLHQIWEKQDLNTFIIERKRDRIIYLNKLKHLINLCAPSMDGAVLSEVLSLPLNQRSGSKLTREILKKTSPEIFKLPTGRSPLSLRYPLWIHQAYQRVFKQGTQLDYWRQGLLDLNTKEYENINLDFLDFDQMNEYISGNKGKSEQIQSLIRLENLRQWLNYKTDMHTNEKTQEIMV